jgi:hypothetical protein
MIEEAVRFFIAYEAVIYFILGLGGIIFAWHFWGAWQEMRTARYGLERENAQQRLNRGAVGIFLLLLMSVGVFSIVTFVAPTLPLPEFANDMELDLLTTREANQLTETGTVEENNQAVTPTMLPTVQILEDNCIPGVIYISSPAQDDTISGEVTVEGSVNVDEFGFYKFEVARPQEELWLTIQAGRNLVQDGILIEKWDTTRLPPGEYVLQLSVIDIDGIAFPPCRISVYISQSGI